jgi:YVTN family beta-propeller protein
MSVLASTTAFAEAGKAYVTNQDGGVTVIDLATMETTGTIDIQATGPRGIGITEDGKYLITASKDDSIISVINLIDKSVNKIPVGKNPEFVRVYNGLVFVSTEPSSKGGPPPKPGEAVKEEADDDKEVPLPARIAVVDITKGKKVREIVGGPETEGIEFSKDGKQVIVTNEADNTITVHDYKSGDLLKTFKTENYGNRPRGIKVSPDGQRYIATLEFSNNFIVLDKDFNYLQTIKTPEAPYGVSFDRSGKKLYVASSKGQRLTVFDTNTWQELKQIGVGKRCWHFSFTPDDKNLLLACGKSDEVLVIDTQKLEVTKHISDKKMPWGIVTYPKSMGSLDNP